MAFPAVHLSSQADAQPLYWLRPHVHLLLCFELHPKIPSLQAKKRLNFEAEKRMPKTRRTNNIDVQLLRPLPESRLANGLDPPVSGNHGNLRLQDSDNHQIYPHHKRHRRPQKSRLHRLNDNNHRKRRTRQTP